MSFRLLHPPKPPYAPFIADDTEPSPLAAVLLRHTLPDGSWHFDLMLERAGDPREHRLMTFRVMTDPLGDAARRFEAEQLADHRAAYLDREGEIGAGRGRVERIWRGELSWLIDRPDHAVAVIDASGLRFTISGRVERGVIWRWERI